MTRALTLRPPAKINLTLRVGAVRADGFHDVRTIMQTVGICDVLTFTPARGPFALTLRAPAVAADRTNLVWRAATALWIAAGRTGGPRDARVRLDKKIPVAAGLGGGSADAAAALVGLNTVWGLGLSRADLMNVAASLGSDVPFFLAGGTAMGVGRGEEIYPLQPLRRMSIVIIKPAFSVSTAEAYRWLDEDRAAGQPGETGSAARLKVAWPAGPLALTNDLQAPVSRRHPGIAEAIEDCLRAGAQAAAMTGSGSAVFGVFPAAIVAKAARRLKRPGWEVFPTQTLSRGESDRLMGL